MWSHFIKLVIPIITYLGLFWLSYKICVVLFLWKKGRYSLESEEIVQDHPDHVVLMRSFKDGYSKIKIKHKKVSVESGRLISVEK